MEFEDEMAIGWDGNPSSAKWKDCDDVFQLEMHFDPAKFIPIEFHRLVRRHGQLADLVAWWPSKMALPWTWKKYNRRSGAGLLEFVNVFHVLCFCVWICWTWCLRFAWTLMSLWSLFNSFFAYLLVVCVLSWLNCLCCLFSIASLWLRWRRTAVFFVEATCSCM